MKTKSNKIYPIHIGIKEELLQSIFIDAFELSSSYWGEVKDKTPPIPPDFPELTYPSERWFYHIMNNEGSLRIYCIHSGNLLGIITKESILTQTEKMFKKYPHLISPILEENYDGIISDIFFQYITMGDLIFG